MARRADMWPEESPRRSRTRQALVNDTNKPDAWIYEPVGTCIANFDWASETTEGGRDMAGILWTIIVILVILWLLGWLAFHVGGGLIHLLIVVAVILFIWNLITGRGARI